MKPVKVTAELCANLGNYESVRLAVEVQLDDGEKPPEVLAVLRKYLATEIRKEIDSNKEVKRDEKGARV